MAADNGEINVMVIYRCMMSTDNRVPKDLDEAPKYFKITSESGDERTDQMIEIVIKQKEIQHQKAIIKAQIEYKKS